MRKKKRLILIWSYLGFAVLLAIIMGSLTDWRRYYSLSKHGEALRGIIISKEPENHQAIRYEYIVAGATLNGTETRGEISVGERFADVRVGDPIDIVVLPAEPGVSCACNPTSLLKTEMLFIVTVVLVGPLAPLLVIALFKSSKRP